MASIQRILSTALILVLLATMATGRAMQDKVNDAESAEEPLFSLRDLKEALLHKRVQAGFTCNTSNGTPGCYCSSGWCCMNAAPYSCMAADKAYGRKRK